MKYLRLLTGHQDSSISKIELFHSKKNAEDSAKEFNDEILVDEYGGSKRKWGADENALVYIVVDLDLQFPSDDYGITGDYFKFRAVIDEVDYEAQCHSEGGGVDLSDCWYDYGSSATVNDALSHIVGNDGVIELIEYAYALWEKK